MLFDYLKKKASNDFVLQNKKIISDDKERQYRLNLERDQFEEKKRSKAQEEERLNEELKLREEKLQLACKRLKLYAEAYAQQAANAAKRDELIFSLMQKMMDRTS